MSLICHCKNITYEAIEQAIDAGSHSLTDLQRSTTVCTRCFGCRFELEGMLRDRLGDAYAPTAFVALRPEEDEAGSSAPPRRMYMPVLQAHRGYDVKTRVTVFNWVDDAELADARPVEVRADLLALDGTRYAVRQALVQPRSLVVMDIEEMLGGRSLPDGAGVVKLVVDASSLGSLRPYFQLISPGGITSTHEKAGPSNMAWKGRRSTHWIFPIGASRPGEEAYFFLTNGQDTPMEDQALVWKGVDGQEVAIPLPVVGLDQSACVGIHDHVPQIEAGPGAGAIRLEPAAHKIAGFMIRHDPGRQQWRIQHL